MRHLTAGSTPESYGLRRRVAIPPKAEKGPVRRGANEAEGRSLSMAQAVAQRRGPVWEERSCQGIKEWSGLSNVVEACRNRCPP